jgi:hypothetical protein
MGILPDYFPVRLWFFTFIYRLPVLRGRHMDKFFKHLVESLLVGKADGECDIVDFIVFRPQFMARPF